MSSFILGLLLVFIPADLPGDLDECLTNAPSRSHPPITWKNDIEKMWGNDPIVSPDTLRAHLPHVRKARECFLALDPNDVPDSYLNDLIWTVYVETAFLAGLRRFQEAFKTFDLGRSYLSSDSLTTVKSAVEAGSLGSLHQNEGFLHYLLGDLSASIGHYLKAYEVTPKTNPSQRIKYLVDIGIIHQRMQDYRSAGYYFERAGQLYERNDRSTNLPASQQARVLQARADLLLEKFADTEPLGEAMGRAQRLARRARSVAKPWTELHARSTLTLSESLGYLGRIEEAIQLNREVQSYARQHNDARLHALSLLKLGTLYTQTEDWTRADSALLRALEIVDGPGSLDYQRRIYLALGRLHEVQTRWAEAETYYRRGVAVVERYRESLTASQWSITAFAQWRDVYRGLVRTLLAQDKDRTALATLDRSRARHLQDLRIRAQLTTQLSASQRVRLDSLVDALVDIRNQLGTSSLPDETEMSLRTRETALMAARQQILSIDSIPERPDVADIQASLRQQGRVLLSYFLDDPRPYPGREPQSTVFVLTSDTLRTVRLPNTSHRTIRRRVRATSSLFKSARSRVGLNAMHFDLRPLHGLQESLYAPVAPLLPAERPLTVVPDGPLFHVPFSMLVRSMPEGRFAPSEARFVLHERPTTQELASSLVVDPTPASRSSTPQDALIAFGVSQFDTLRTVPQALRSALPGELLNSSSLTLPDLPGVRSELRSVQRQVKGARVFLDAAATEDTFRRTSQQASVLHLASHAFVHPSTPLQNAFVLRSSSSREGGDGILFLHELQNRLRPLSLVVLSGCNTARGTLRGGEGMEGLQYAFRAMGAQATLSSLWPVADDANVALMDAFYRHLRRGLRKDEALRQAKLEYLAAHPERASPFFWASTVLYGSPAPLTLESSSLLPRWGWWGVALLVAGLSSLLVWRWRRTLGFRGCP